MATAIVLGPQRLAPTVGEVVAGLGIRGPVATITAGWQEREGETGELHAALGVPARDLALWTTLEAVFEQDRALFELHRARQDRLRARQALYRLRLQHLQAAARAVRGAQATPELVEPELAHAIEQVRALDARHLDSVRAEHDAFEVAARPVTRVALARARGALREALTDCEAAVVAGGHVATLVNRLRLLDLGPPLARLPVVIAWSAGAMALADRVVLFHDHPPQGRGNAEILDAGLGLLPGLVPLPHARRRLALDDRARVSLFARRFAPAACLTLDEGDRVDLRDARLVSASGTRRLGHGGNLEPL